MGKTVPMAKAVRSKFARWFLALALLLIARSATPTQGGSVIPWDWLYANGLVLACFVLATLLFAYDPIKWWLDRRYAKDLQRQSRANLSPLSFDQMDAADALQYLLKESVWGWEAYARLNHWQVVDGFHFREFVRAAREREIIS